MRTIDKNRFAPLARMLARRAEAARQRRDMKLLSGMPEYLLRDIGCTAATSPPSDAA